MTSLSHLYPNLEVLWRLAFTQIYFQVKRKCVSQTSGAPAYVKNVILHHCPTYVHVHLSHL